MGSLDRHRAGACIDHPCFDIHRFAILVAGFPWLADIRLGFGVVCIPLQDVAGGFPVVGCYYSR